MLEEEILSDIGTIAKNENLYREKNFYLRLQAIDHLEFHVIDRIDGLLEKTETIDPLNLLKQYAEKVKCSLEDVNNKMFNQLRKKISEAGYRGKLLAALFDEYFDNNLNKNFNKDLTGYDNLDVFLNGLLTNHYLPVETKEREPGMVYYQKTPARIILELIKKAEFNLQDVFFDLGSGLGQAAILVNLLTSVISKGVEIEPAFCSYAKTCAADLNLKEMEFINTDARYADYSSGTVFFMYTPFEGKMLQDVLQSLKAEAKKRKIKIFTYGSCTVEVARQRWLRKGKESYHLKGLNEFLSL